MARKIASKIVKEAAKRAKDKFKPNPNAPQSRAISGIPEKGTVGAYKGPKAKATPATTKGRGRPKGSKNKAKASPATGTSLAVIKPKTGTSLATTPKSVVSETLKKSPALSTIAKGSAIAGLIGGGAGLGNFILKGRREKAAQSKPISFGQAFKKARAQGEGTKFTWKGKSYTAVTKDDLKKKGYDANELRQYANRKGKARGPLNRLGQKAKKVLLGKDKKFGGDKGAIDFIRKPKKKASGGLMRGTVPPSRSRKAPLTSGPRPMPSGAKAIGGGGRGGYTPAVASPNDPKSPRTKTPRTKIDPRKDPRKAALSGTRPVQRDTRTLRAPKERIGMAKGGSVKKFKAGGMATKGLGKAYMKSKR